MKLSWLNNSGNEDLIVFFSGWSVEPEHLSFLRTDGFDVAMFHSYDSFELPEINTEKYKNVTVAAFSFGVFIASVSLKRKNISKENFAVNGTFKPVDNSFGIRKMVFEKTLSGLNDETFRQFKRNMFDDDAGYFRFENSYKTVKTIAVLKKELEFIRDNLERPAAGSSIFAKTVISKNDRIIPARNQIEFWKNCKNEIMESGHFPFYKFQSWNELIALCRK